jgi:hypothetical protein
VYLTEEKQLNNGKAMAEQLANDGKAIGKQ